MVDFIIASVEKDYQIGHVNEKKICDEVHVNKFFVKNKSTLLILNEGYAHPAEGLELKKGKRSKWKGERIISHHNSAQNRTWRFANNDFDYRKNSKVLVSLPVCDEDPVWIEKLIENLEDLANKM